MEEIVIESSTLHAGYVNDFDEALLRLEAHKLATKTRFSTFSGKSLKTFGRTDWTKTQSKICWSQIQGETCNIPFDGIPYMSFGSLRLDCCHGPKRSNSTQIKNEKIYVQKCLEAGYPLKRRRSRVTKKLSCPASVKFVEIVKFPDYEVVNNTLSRRNQTSQKLRMDLANGENVSGERRIYYEFPTLHKYHPYDQTAMDASMSTEAMESTEETMDHDHHTDNIIKTEIYIEESHTSETADDLCFICKSTEGNPPKAFEQNSWDKLKMAAHSRTSQKSDRYRNITNEVIEMQDMGSARYHPKCFQKFTAVKKLSRNSRSNHYSSKKHLHACTFEALSDLIEMEVIGNRRPMYFSSVLELYRNEFLSEGGTKENMKYCTVEDLLKRIKDVFGEQISIHVSSYDQKSNFIFSSAMSEDDAKAVLNNDVEKKIDTIRNTALYLRAVTRTLPDWGTQSQTSVLPEELFVFYKTLLCGISESSGNELRVQRERKVVDMSLDVVNFLSNDDSVVL